MLSRLATYARDWAQVPTRIRLMEETMATAKDQLEALSGRVDDLVSDVRAALDALRQDRENFSPEGQAAFDTLDQKVSAFDTEVGDADGSDTPATPEEPTEPGTDTFR